VDTVIDVRREEGSKMTILASGIASGIMILVGGLVAIFCRQVARLITRKNKAAYGDSLRGRVPASPFALAFAGIGVFGLGLFFLVHTLVTGRP
jgi:hypothetical protein